MTTRFPLQTGRTTSSWFVAAGLILTVVLTGFLVYHKAVRLRQGDQYVFFHAGWSVRQGGADLYEFVDEHGWHYHYPPLFAILMVPLAEPPPQLAVQQHGAILSPTMRVMLLYVFNLVGLVVSLRLLTGCLDLGTIDPRRRLQLMIWPVVFCLPALGLTLIRGQIDVLLVLLIACFVAALASGRSYLAGLPLAAAICIKIIPAFLLILPLWRRDKRCLTSCAASLVVGLWLVPALVLGPARTINLYSRQLDAVIRPALGTGKDDSRAEELLDARATVNQSFQMVLHLTLHFGQKIIPLRPAPWIRGIHWATVALLTGMVLWRHGRPTVWTGRQLLLVTSLLTVLMVLASPVCHLHYFTLVLPLALLVTSALREGQISRFWLAAPLLFLLGCTAFMLPAFANLRDLGMPMYTTMGLWMTGWWCLREQPSGQRETPREHSSRPSHADLLYQC